MIEFANMNWGTAFHILAVVTIVGRVDGFSRGYALDSTAFCQTMSPNHGAWPQTKPSTFRLGVSQVTYRPGEEVDVTLEGGTLTGFMLQARKVGRAHRVGTFEPLPGLANSICRKQALSHIDGADKAVVRARWKAPETAAGEIEFVATVVQSRQVFWVGLKSVKVTATTPTTPVTPTTTTAMAEETVSETALAVDTSACGKSRGCMRKPQGCSPPDCELLVSWRRSETTMSFVMTARSDGYAALGFSRDKRMDQTSVIECTKLSGGLVVVRFSYCEGNSVVPLAEPPEQLGLNSALGRYKDGFISCTFTKDIGLVGNNSKVYDIDADYRLMLAVGPVVGDLVSEHSRLPSVSYRTVVVTRDIVDLRVDPSLFYKSHAVIMISAWMLCASLGTFLARYHKGTWPGKEFCGQKVWFTLHRFLMLLSMFLNITAFVLVFVEAQKWCSWGVVQHDAHPYIGCVVTLLVIVNPLMAACRPRRGQPARPAFNWAHWAAGHLAHILGIVNIFLGMLLPQASEFTPKSSFYLMFCFIGWHVVMTLLMEFQRWRRWRRSTAESYDMAQGNIVSSAVMDNARTTDPLLKPFLILYAAVTTVLWLGIIIVMIFN